MPRTLLSSSAVNCRFLWAGNWELVKSILGTNFEEAMFYILKREIEYLLQAL